MPELRAGQQPRFRVPAVVGHGYPRVSGGRVTLSGRPRDTSLVPVAARLVRAVEGVVDVEFDPPNGDVVRQAD